MTTLKQKAAQSDGKTRVAQIVRCSITVGTLEILIA